MDKIRDAAENRTNKIQCQKTVKCTHQKFPRTEGIIFKLLVLHWKIIKQALICSSCGHMATDHIHTNTQSNTWPPWQISASSGEDIFVNRLTDRASCKAAVEDFERLTIKCEKKKATHLHSCDAKPRDWGTVSSAFHKTLTFICRKCNPSPGEKQHVIEKSLGSILASVSTRFSPWKSLKQKKKNWETSGRHYQAIPTTWVQVLQMRCNENISYFITTKKTFPCAIL